MSSYCIMLPLSKICIAAKWHLVRADADSSKKQVCLLNIWENHKNGFAKCLSNHYFHDHKMRETNAVSKQEHKYSYMCKKWNTYTSHPIFIFFVGFIIKTKCILSFITLIKSVETLNLRSFLIAVVFYLF